MRCPKCGYISFDHLETCRKCNKNIGDTVADINGTVCAASSPSFLRLKSKNRFHAQLTDQNPLGTDNEQEVAVIEDLDTDFSDFALGDEEIPLVGESKELVMDLDGFNEVSPQEEYSLDLEENRSGIETNLPPLDFGDLDISDLAPPDREGLEGPLLEEELELAIVEPVAVLSKNLPHKQTTPTTKSTGLEDLHVNGLHLDAPAKFVAGSAAGKRYLPSVKTGTALDKFDVDLGELFVQNKK